MQKNTHNRFLNTFSMRFYLKISLLFICFTLSTRAFYYFMTEGFCLNRIEAPIHFNGDLSVTPPSPHTLSQLSSIANQKFLYLKKGSQAYAFISEDGQYILKLFKYHHMQSADWLRSIPVPEFIANYRDTLAKRRDYRISLTLQSYKIATESLIDECALVYAQILPSTAYTLPVTIVDSIGRTYHINLATHGYAIQKCVKLVLPSFETWIEKREITQAKSAIDSLCHLIVQRSRKGIQDSDPDLHKNAGLLGTKAVFIDIGSFFLNPEIRKPEEIQRDLKKIFAHFSEWLSPRSPELASYLEERLSSQTTLFGLNNEKISVVCENPQ